SAFRSGTARLHRRFIRHAGGDHRACHPDEPFPFRHDTRNETVARAEAHHPAAGRPAHAGYGTAVDLSGLGFVGAHEMGRGGSTHRVETERARYPQSAASPSRNGSTVPFSLIVIGWPKRSLELPACARIQPSLTQYSETSVRSLPLNRIPLPCICSSSC